jgi:hypothetical protein
MNLLLDRVQVTNEIETMTKSNLKKVKKARVLLRLFLILPVGLLPFYAAASCRGQEVVDKMVATVNAGVHTDLITYSD